MIKKSELVTAGAQDLRRSARYLASRANRVDNEEFTLMQQAVGLTHHEHNLLLDRELDDVVDPVEHYLHDMMHCLIVDGVCNIHVYLLLEECISAGMTNVYSRLSGYMTLFEWPGRVYWHQLPDIFSDSRKKKHRDARHIKCQAADMLSMMPVIALYCHLELLAICPKACSSLH